MATKTKSVTAKKLSVPVLPEPKSISVTIKLTKTEAEDILRLCQHVGGKPEETRGIFDELVIALESSGVVLPPRGKRIVSEGKGQTPSGIYFTNYEDRAKLPITH